LVVQEKLGGPLGSTEAKIASKAQIDDLRSRKCMSEAADELDVGLTTLKRWFRVYYPDFDVRWSKEQTILDVRCELERRLEEVHEHWRAGHSMQHTVRALNIQGLTVHRLRDWCDRRVTRIYWRHRLNCRDLSPDLDWFIDYNE
jgi:hypothetical protein